MCETIGLALWWSFWVLVETDSRTGFTAATNSGYGICKSRCLVLLLLATKRRALTAAPWSFLSERRKRDLIKIIVENQAHWKLKTFDLRHNFLENLLALGSRKHLDQNPEPTRGSASNWGIQLCGISKSFLLVIQSTDAEMKKRKKKKATDRLKLHQKFCGQGL